LHVERPPVDLREDRAHERLIGVGDRSRQDVDQFRDRGGGALRLEVAHPPIAHRGAKRAVFGEVAAGDGQLAQHRQCVDRLWRGTPEIAEIVRQLPQRPMERAEDRRIAQQRRGSIENRLAVRGPELVPVKQTGTDEAGGGIRSQRREIRGQDVAAAPQRHPPLERQRGIERAVRDGAGGQPVRGMMREPGREPVEIIGQDGIAREVEVGQEKQKQEGGRRCDRRQQRLSRDARHDAASSSTRSQAAKAWCGAKRAR
jgi:hypothetical protein